MSSHSRLIILCIAVLTFALFFLHGTTFAAEEVDQYSAITTTNSSNNSTIIELYKWNDRHWTILESETILGHVVPRRAVQLSGRMLLIIGVYNDKTRKIRNLICLLGECRDKYFELKLSTDEIREAKIIDRDFGALIAYESVDHGMKHLRYTTNISKLEEIETSDYLELIEDVDDIEMKYSVKNLPISRLSCDSISQLIDGAIGRNYAIVFVGQRVIRFTPFSDSQGCKNQF